MFTFPKQVIFFVTKSSYLLYIRENLYFHTQGPFTPIIEQTIAWAIAWILFV